VEKGAAGGAGNVAALGALAVVILVPSAVLVIPAFGANKTISPFL